MIRFAKPDGTPFDLNYMGDIHVFDEGNDRVAICVCSQNGSPAPESIQEALEDLGFGSDIRAVPEDWDCWEILDKSINPDLQRYLQGAIVAAWTSNYLLMRMLADTKKE